MSNIYRNVLCILGKSVSPAKAKKLASEILETVSVGPDFEDQAVALAEKFAEDARVEMSFEQANAANILRKILPASEIGDIIDFLSAESLENQDSCEYLIDRCERIVDEFQDCERNITLALSSDFKGKSLSRRVSKIMAGLDFLSDVPLFEQAANAMQVEV